MPDAARRYGKNLVHSVIISGHIQMEKRSSTEDMTQDRYRSATDYLKKISKDLKKRGFKYVGPVTIYSHLQACGMINDHDADCPCRKKIVEQYPAVYKQRYKEKF